MKREDFNITDINTDKKTTDNINVCFTRIQEMINNYSNYSTEQDFIVFTYDGYIEKDTVIETQFVIDGQIPVYGINYSNSLIGNVYLGEFKTNKFTPAITAQVFICQPMKIYNI